MFFAFLGHTGERLQDHWSSGLKVAAHLRSCFEKVGSLPHVFIVYICAHTFPR